MIAPPIVRYALLGSAIALLACGSSDAAGAGGSTDDAGLAAPLDASSSLAGDSGPGDGASSADAPSSVAHDGGAASDSATGGDAGRSDAATLTRALGYYTGTQASYAAVTSFGAYLNMVSADLFEAQSDGSLAGSDDYDVAAYDNAHGIDTYAVVSNYSETVGDFDPALAHAAMVDHESALVAAIVKLAGTGYRGVNVDFENLAYSTNVADDRSAYTKLITDLGAALHAQGKELIISVPGKTQDDPGNTWAYPFDFAALAPHVDYMQVMTYDEYGPGWSGPGPVAGLDWMETCVKYTVSLVPPSKILSGLPAYAADWDLTASTPSKSVGTSPMWKDVPALLAGSNAATHRDAASSTPYADYTSKDGHKHQIWYDDAASITAKAALARKYGLRGVSMWSLGQEDLSFWQAVRAGDP
jgi:spore germination protein YaaH